MKRWSARKVPQGPSYGVGMARLRQIADKNADLESRLAETERRLENMVRVGKVTDVDPAKQLYRQEIGKDPSGKVQLGPWRPYSQSAGDLKVHAPPTIGQLMMKISMSGDVEQGVGFPFGWSLANPSPGTTLDHVKTYKDNIKRVMSDGKIVWTLPQHLIGDGNDPPAGVNAAQELNRQIQGHRAELTQHRHSIAALHDTMSTLNTIAMTVIPQLAQLAPQLNNLPDGLKICEDQVLGKLQNYMNLAMQEAVSKLTNGFMNPSTIINAVTGLVGGQIGGMLGQIEALAAGAGISSAIADSLAQANGFVSAASSGSTEGLAGAVAGMAGSFAGTAAESAFAAIQGQLSGVLGTASGLAQGLGGLVEAQADAVEGIIHSQLIGAS